ncbi:unnamed protein product [Linum trigynum]|uniref:Uncharacterized protein n=1 Tax=Linum trigynum TaxID=586398 RepID=A0AAV2GAC4_9ROSI
MARKCSPIELVSSQGKHLGTGFSRLVLASHTGNQRATLSGKIEGVGPAGEDRGRRRTEADRCGEMEHRGRPYWGRYTVPANSVKREGSDPVGEKEGGGE